jgi:hypothetical protein
MPPTLNFQRLVCGLIPFGRKTLVSMRTLVLSTALATGAAAADTRSKNSPPPAAPSVAPSQSKRIETGSGNTIRAEIRLGGSDKYAVYFEFAGGHREVLQAKLQSDVRVLPVDKNAPKPAPATRPTEGMPDAFIGFSGMGLQFSNHVRPRLKRYTEEQAARLAEGWNTLPSASQHWTTLEVRSRGRVHQLWMDGRFCGTLPPTVENLKAVHFQLEPGAELRNGVSLNRPDHDRFLPLDIADARRPGVMQTAALSLASGGTELDGIPFLVAEAAHNADVGVVKEMQGPRFLETNENTSRTALDGMPESIHFSVPQQFYHRAWVLCAAEADPKKDPVFTARLTRFANSGRGGAIADTLVEVPQPGGPNLKGAREVGAVEYADTTGAKKRVPLHLIPVDLHTGDILDLLSEEKDPYAAMKIGPYLDFEFLGKCGGLEVQNDHRRRPLKTSTSGVHIFGVTLETAGVETRLKQAQPGNIFHNGEKPETRFAFRANAAGNYKLACDILDTSGGLIRSTTTPFHFAAPGNETEISVDLKTADQGWFGMHIRVVNEAGDKVLEHNGSFAVLGEDTRKAGYESPYGTWWFGGAHYSTRDLQVVGPMLFKAGLRRVPVGWTKDTEADMAPWKISLNQISWPFRTADLENWPAAVERVEKLVREKLANFPHCRYVDIFHESFDNVLPPELHGGTYAAKQPEKEEKLYELGLRGARFFREKFPQLKLVVGNSGGSAGTVAMLLRRGFPRDLIDYLGSETTGQTIAPEKLMVHTTAGLWLLKQTARTFGHEIPLTGCYEFTCRAERDLTPQIQAEWYTRDLLFGLAYRFPTVSPGEIEDVSNAYYDNFYGAAGLCERRGLHYPKRAYVAVATLTKVLDSVELLRQMPTESSSAHALEFRRGAQTVYALWTPRGDCEMELAFPEGASLEKVGFYGKRETLATSAGRVRVTASPAVCYVVSSARALKCTPQGRSFPLHAVAPDARVIAGPEQLADIELGAGEPRMDTATLRPGKFELRRTEDPEKGACLELELKREGTLPEIVGEYAALRLKQPVPLGGNPHTLGIWVKGDSSYGRVYWELEDAKGERWISNGGYDGGDWGNHSALNFEGWCHVTFPISNESPALHLEPGRGLGLWRGHSDGRLDPPLKLTGVYLETYRNSLDLTEMRPVKKNLRIHSVTAQMR